MKNVLACGFVALVACGAPDDHGPDASLGTIESEVTINGGDFGGADLIPANGDILNGTFTNVGTFRINPGVTVLVMPGVPLDVTAEFTIIDGGLNGSNAGSPGGAVTPAGPADGTDGIGLGRGRRGKAGPCVHGGGGGGAGYGGAGGQGGYAFSDGSTLYPNGGGIYGSDVDTLVELGSGGGGGGSGCSDFGQFGGGGGGSIRILSTSITVNGVITADGAPGGNVPSNGGGAGGGGSGGGIALIAGTLAGTGSVTANGGNGGSEPDNSFEGDGGGGGGGKIKLGTAATFSTSVTGGTVGPCTGGSSFCPAAGNAGKVLGVAAALLSPDPGSIGFGNVRVGQTSSPQTVRLRNTGSLNLTITAISTAAPFAVSNLPSLPATIVPGGDVQITATFSPTVLGAANGAITVDSNDATSPTLIPLSGTGAEPAISVDPTSVAFGNQRVGTTGNRSVLVTNTGNAPLTITSISTSAPFSNADVTPIVIGPGANRTLTVGFTPPAVGPFAADLTITSDAATSPTVVPLSGTGIAPAIAVDPTSVAFGNQRVATTGNRSVLVTNTGTDTLNISSVTAGGAFANADATPIAVGPGNSTTLTVTFTPPGLGPFAADLTIVSDAATSPTIVPLSGTGVAPAIAIDPTSIAFGNQRVTTTGNRSLLVTNTGTDTLTITSIVTGGAFSNIDTLPIVIAPGADRTLAVSFTPPGLGLFAIDMSIVSDAATSPTIVPLSGTGVAPAISVDPTSLAFGNQRVATTGNRSLTVTNTGTDALTITSIAAGGAFANADGTPIVIAPGNNATLTVTFTPLVVGGFNANLTILSDAATSPTIVPLSGTGVEPAISVDPTSIDFGDQRVATSANRTVLVENTGTDTLTITSITAGGAFTNVDAVPISVPPSGNTTLTVTFTPPTSGPHVGSLTIVSDATTSPTILALAGNGVEPLVTLTDAPVVFGNRRVGITGAPKSVLVTNTGTSSLSISSVTIAAPFAITAPTSSVVLAPTTSVSIDIVFTPTVVGAVSRTLTITSDAASSPTTFLVSGTGVEPGLTPSTTTLAFGVVKTGTTSASQTFTLTNTGDFPAQITSASAPAQFAITGPTLPISVLPNTELTFAVTFSPAADGAASGDITFVSDAPAVPVIALDGTGGSPQIVPSPNALDFGEVAIGTISVPRAVTIQNPGPAPLQVTGITVGPPFTRASIALPATIAAGASQTLDVMFAPTSPGSANGTITITSDASSVVIPLTGTGLEAPEFADGGCCGTTRGGPSSVLLAAITLLLCRRRAYRKNRK